MTRRAARSAPCCWTPAATPDGTRSIHIVPSGTVPTTLADGWAPHRTAGPARNLTEPRITERQGWPGAASARLLPGQTAAADRTRWSALTCPLGCAGPGPPKFWPTTNRCGSWPRLSAQAKTPRSRSTVARARGERRGHVIGEMQAPNLTYNLGSWGAGRRGLRGRVPSLVPDDMRAAHDFSAGPRRVLIRVLARVGAGVAARCGAAHGVRAQALLLGELVTCIVNRPNFALEVSSRICAMREICASVYGLFGSPSSAFSTA